MWKVVVDPAGQAGRPYPNGGEERQWMGRVAGALKARLEAAGALVLVGEPGEAGWDLYLALGSLAAPPGQEGSRKGPAVLCRERDLESLRAAGLVAEALGRAYPQPELVCLLPARDPLPGPGPALDVKLGYRDNPQDEAWLTASVEEVGAALARGVLAFLEGPDD